MNKQKQIEQIDEILQKCDATTVEAVLAVVSRFAEVEKEHALARIFRQISELI